MACFKPTIIRDIKNMKTQSVPCGKCNFCRRDKKNDWVFRLLQHEKKSVNSSFITLTYDNEHLPRQGWLHKGVETPNPNGAMTLVKHHLQQFHKSLKEFELRLTGEKSKTDYYAAGEYGSKFGRPHYHTILMNHHPKTINQLPSLWDKGQIHIGQVTPASVAYVAKYIIDKQFAKWTPVKPFNMMSKGIGADYLTPQMIAYHKPDEDMDNAIYYVQHNGYKSKMPRYYRDRIFTDEERRELGAMQYALGMEKKAAIIEHLALQELETETIQALHYTLQGMAAWEKGLKRYLEQVELKHEKISRKSIQCNSL